MLQERQDKVRCSRPSESTGHSPRPYKGVCAGLPCPAMDGLCLSTFIKMDGNKI